jgi:4-hydroxy-tetrahydrodipicolinate synthase
MQLQGAITAAITPFQDDGSIDLKSFENFIQWQLAEGINGLVALGSTGESMTLIAEEKRDITAVAATCLKGHIPLIIGVGSNSTKETILQAQAAQDNGADILMVVCPFYNKPTQDGLYQHFISIAGAVDIPIILYNVPGRTAVDINDATVAKLAEHPRIIGLKDATGDLVRPLNLRHALGPKRDNFTMLSGEDATCVAFNANGGKGCISVTSNIFPAFCAKIQALSLEGRTPEALVELEKVYEFMQTMFIDTNPIPVKYAAYLAGKIATPKMRLPLLELDEMKKQIVLRVFNNTTESLSKVDFNTHSIK